MTLEQYLQSNQIKLSVFAKQYNLDYHRLFRVKQGRVTRDKHIKAIFKELDISNAKGIKQGEPNTSFISQERICIQCERAGDIYCYYVHHLQEIEDYLIHEDIPHYVRKIKDGWLVRYDKEALR